MVAAAYPLAVVESDTARVSVLPVVESDTARVSVLPVAGSELQAVFWGKVALDVVGLGIGTPCLRVDSEENPAGFARRARRDEFYSSGSNSGWWTYGGGASSGTHRAFGSGKAPG